MVEINKKGVAEGVDWIIAGGIFLIYLGLVFVFFKPGVKTTYDYNELGDLVETNLKKDLLWNTTKIPIFTKAINFQDDERTESTKLKGQKTIKFSFSDSEVDADKIKRIIGSDGVYTKIERTDNSLCVEFRFEETGYTRLIGFDTIPSYSTLNCNDVDKEHTACSKVELDKELGRDFNEDTDISASCGAIYKIGSPEYLEGLNMSNVTNENKAYESLKVKWNFPDNKDFKIVLYSSSDNNCKDFGSAKRPDFGCVINTVEPPTTSNVFVKEVTVYALNDNGELSQWVMNIRIW